MVRISLRQHENSSASVEQAAKTMQSTSSVFLMEAYHEDKLVGFDVIDFFKDNRIMVVPLGFT